MITRLPGWVWPVAWLLAFDAGAVNAIGLLGAAHQAVSHLTGTTSLLATAVAAGKTAEIARYAGVALAFVAGAAISGAVIPGDPLHLGKRQSALLLGVAALMFAAQWHFANGGAAALHFAAAACGLQNAMTTSYSGAVVRTSHVSGMFTDVGIALGHVLRRAPVHPRRLLLCTVVIAGFFAGGLAAALAFARVGYAALSLPAALTTGLAIVNAVHVLRRRRL
ncbi:YoaK family protein [Cognatilysobacter segetis]|uniref:YoaK family protein n=1 Tax=Cognatilysobacter segetis TaxID=2492394 RepID=UPI00105CA9D2|nr:YoaK family protein [Lysobacter segetis]